MFIIFFMGVEVKQSYIDGDSCYFGFSLIYLFIDDRIIIQKGKMI